MSLPNNSKAFKQLQASFYTQLFNLISTSLPERLPPKKKKELSDGFFEISTPIS